jgi:hypothetical protein
MIRLENISKQNGQQISSSRPRPRSKGREGRARRPERRRQDDAVPHDHRQEQPDEGQVSVDRGVTIGYFSQDVGEMAGPQRGGRGDGRRRPGQRVAAELKELEAAMGDPDRADEMDEIIARYGEVQARFEELDGYALEGRAREVLAGLGFQPGDDGRRCRQAVRRLEDARGAGPHPADAARRHAARRAVATISISKA